ncbi:hypothetical protein ZWY2020_013832 [Hordeum vulgare]|nr:hypothetical protein ZWY2020_013832 [Hordeum vulgare]
MHRRGTTGSRGGGAWSRLAGVALRGEARKAELGPCSTMAARAKRPLALAVTANRRQRAGGGGRGVTLEKKHGRPTQRPWPVARSDVTTRCSGTYVGLWSSELSRTQVVGDE